MDNRLLNAQATKLGSWLSGNGYVDLVEWGFDSDYKMIDGVWFDEMGNEVNIFECALYAMEAANGAV
jgi:hypothetical protein